MSLFICNKLTKRYGSTLALDKVDLSLEAGAPIALIGPNGAGKTTLLSLLCGYLRATSGELTILGQAPGSAALHGRLAALPQDAQLDPRFTIGHQLQLFARLQGLSKAAARKEIMRVLELVDLKATYSQKPEALSHGMRKRVMLAQALIGSPELILLDEPTAGLDPPNVKQMRALIGEVATQATFVISSHNLDELEKVCQTVVHLEHGKLKTVVDIAQAHATGETSYLTVVLGHLNQAESVICQSLAGLPGVKQVSFSAPSRFVIEYDAISHDGLDLLLLQHLASQGWVYRQLINGRSLEDRLYF